MPINLGPLVNSPFDDISPHVSKNGRSLYFASTRDSGSFGGEDIWISRRATDDDAWGVPVNLGRPPQIGVVVRDPAACRVHRPRGASSRDREVLHERGDWIHDLVEVRRERGQ